MPYYYYHVSNKAKINLQVSYWSGENGRWKVSSDQGTVNRIILLLIKCIDYLYLKLSSFLMNLKTDFLEFCLKLFFYHKNLNSLADFSTTMLSET